MIHDHISLPDKPGSIYTSSRLPAKLYDHVSYAYSVRSKLRSLVKAYAIVVGIVRPRFEVAVPTLVETGR